MELAEKLRSRAPIKASARIRQRLIRGTLSFLRLALLFILGFIIIYPLLKTLSRAFMPIGQYSDPSIIWIPKSLTLTNIRAALQALDYWNTLLRTVILCLGCAVLQVISSSVIGYGFARFQFPGRKLLFGFVILTIVIPTQLVFIPLMVQYRFFDFLGIGKLIGVLTGNGGEGITVNLINSRMTFYLPSLLGVGVRSGLFIYIFRQFFRNIPKELEEAAKIDGCGPFKTFLRVMLPNAKSSVLTVFLFSVVWHWNETMMANSFFSAGNRTLAVTVQGFATQEALAALANQGFFKAAGRNLQAGQALSYAALVLFLLPPLLLYIFTQRYFVEGVESTGIKG